MSRARIPSLLLVALILAAFTSCAATPAAAQAQAKRAVIVVIDACRADYLQLGSMPAIEQLAREGVSYRRAWTGHLINNTPPGHLTIASGCLPKTTGVIGFGWRDPETGRRVQPTAWEPIVSGEYAELIARSGAPTIAGLLKKAEPDAVAAAVGSVKFYAVASLGADTADYIAFTPHQPKAPKGGGPRPQMPMLTLENMGVPGHLPPQTVLEAVQRLYATPRRDPDQVAMEMTLALVREAQPTLLMVNLPQTDGAGHQSGGITAPEVMRGAVQNADAQIGRLVALYKSLGLYDETVWVVTSDHGMIPDAHAIPRSVINVAMLQAGLKPQGKGGDQHLWLPDPSRAREVALAIAAQRVPDVHAAFYKVRQGNRYRFELAEPIGPKASPQAVAAYQFLADTYACPNGPDVSVFSAENTMWGSKPKAPGSRGRHNTATWGTQHVPLIIAGPGVRTGVTSDYPARLCDIAPTVLSALGIAPRDMDGVVLADAVADPRAWDSQAQANREAELAPLVEALEQQAQADLARLGLL